VLTFSGEGKELPLIKKILDGDSNHFDGGQFQKKTSGQEKEAAFLREQVGPEVGGPGRPGRRKVIELEKKKRPGLARKTGTAGKEGKRKGGFAIRFG